MPTPYFFEVSVLVLSGMACAFPLIYLNVRWASKLGLIDWPKARGVAEDQVPIIGPSLIVIFVAAVSVLMLVYPISPWFLTTALIMAVMGYIDDRRPLPAMDKMFFQSICVVTVVLLDPQLRIAIGDKYGAAGSIWAVFFILGLVNAINFVDGIDGLAGIVIFVGSAGVVLFSRPYNDQYPYLVLASLLCGMIVPFLYFNVLRRKGFLGNMGSYFFSYVLAVMHMSIPIDTMGPVSRLSISGLCFLIPIADAATVLTWRALTLRSPFEADKGHLHHRLIQTSLPLRQVLACFGLIEAVALILAAIIQSSPAVLATYLPSFLCFALAFLTSVLILLIEKGSRRRIQAYFQRLDSGEPIYFMKYQITKADGSTISPRTLRRLEAKVSAEIRVTDLCYTEKPNVLFVTLRTMPEPLRGISSRIDTVFQAERVQTILVIDQGEFVKVSRVAGLPQRKVS